MFNSVSNSSFVCKFENWTGRLRRTGVPTSDALTSAEHDPFLCTVTCDEMNEFNDGVVAPGVPFVDDILLSDHSLGLHKCTPR